MMRMRCKYRVGQKVSVVRFGDSPFIGTVSLSRIVDVGGERYEKVWVKNDVGEEHACASFDGQCDGIVVV